jgi:hypothetical protein
MSVHRGNVLEASAKRYKALGQDLFLRHCAFVLRHVHYGQVFWELKERRFLVAEAIVGESKLVLRRAGLARDVERQLVSGGVRENAQLKARLWRLAL